MINKYTIMAIFALCGLFCAESFAAIPDTQTQAFDALAETLGDKEDAQDEYDTVAASAAAHWLMHVSYTAYYNNVFVPSHGTSATVEGHLDAAQTALDLAEEDLLVAQGHLNDGITYFQQALGHYDDHQWSACVTKCLLAQQKFIFTGSYCVFCTSHLTVALANMSDAMTAMMNAGGGAGGGPGN